MKIKIKGLVTFFFSFNLTVFSATFTTLSTADGEWMNAAVWNGSAPGTYTIGGSGHNCNIYGKISVGSSLSNQTLTIDKGLLSVYDTLIIYGDLVIGNNGDLSINQNAFVLVYGNVTIANQVTIAANSYFIIMGSFTKTGSETQGSFTSDDTPSNVYIGGSINIPKDWGTETNGIFQCDTSDLYNHESTECNYGDIFDLIDSPVGDIISKNCEPLPVINNIITTDTSLIEGDTLSISADVIAGGSTTISGYYWNGPSGFFSSTGSAALIRDSATIDMTGYYLFTIVNSNYCKVTDSIYIQIVRCVDGVTGGVIASDQEICYGEDVAEFISTETAAPGTGYSYQWYLSIDSDDPSTGTWIPIIDSIRMKYNHDILTQTTYFYRRAEKGSACSANSNVLSVTVKDLPLPSFTEEITNACLNLPGNIYSTQPGQSDYKWEISAGGIITTGGSSTDHNVTITWISEGSQFVSINYKNLNNCEGNPAAKTNVNVTLTPITGAQFRLPNY